MQAYLTEVGHSFRVFEVLVTRGAVDVFRGDIGPEN